MRTDFKISASPEDDSSDDERPQDDNYWETEDGPGYPQGDGPIFGEDGNGP